MYKVPFKVSSTTSTTLSNCCTPTTDSPLRSPWLRCPCGTHPAKTSFLFSFLPDRTALMKLSSEGPFTVQLLRSHKSASSGDSIGQLNHMIRSHDPLTSDSVTIGNKLSSHILPVAVVMGTAPCLQVDHLSSGNDAVCYDWWVGLGLPQCLHVIEHNNSTEVHSFDRRYYREYLKI